MIFRFRVTCLIQTAVILLLSTSVFGQPLNEVNALSDRQRALVEYFKASKATQAALQQLKSLIGAGTASGTNFALCPECGRQEDIDRQLGTYASDFRQQVSTGWRLAEVIPLREPNLADETFVAAQWVGQTSAGLALARMSARLKTMSAELEPLIIRREELNREWHRSPDADLEKEINKVDKQLGTVFPAYLALAVPRAIERVEVQRLLDDKEALFLTFEATDKQMYAWLITKNEVRWVRSPLDAESLAHEVAALRCGLDAAVWETEEGQNKCLDLGTIPKGDLSLPFDAQRAHTLYKALFSQVEDIIKGRDLLVVPSGPLTQLPFQVLVTAPSTRGDHKSAAWLAREHAITVLPSVSSLKALRHVARPSGATQPMVGFGNPLLDGQQSDPKYGTYYKNRAELAAAKQSCPSTKTDWQHMSSLFGPHRGVAPLRMRYGLATLADLRIQTPLPETADELCAVARDLKAGDTDIRLGTRATEQNVKALSASGALARYRIVHFATHGALAGQFSGTTEPGLILTPPDIATLEDDGYLSASEIAGLKLDADWVILSACNTAAGGADSAESLSGLASAFFYAKARALLVSHWAVYSDATVKLITNAIREMTVDARIGRAEALRRAMIALLEKGQPHETHPSFWAPFVLVGEGAPANHRSVALSGRLGEMGVGAVEVSIAEQNTRLAKYVSAASATDAERAEHENAVLRVIPPPRRRPRLARKAPIRMSGKEKNWNGLDVFTNATEGK